jgi:hypothetical protein
MFDILAAGTRKKSLILLVWTLGFCKNVGTEILPIFRDLRRFALALI